jgi:signal transduction histidine kinase
VEEKKQVILAIRDDGQGIDPQKLNRKEKTLGLLGMRERALMMGGVLTINSEAGEGMTVYVKVPMEPTMKIPMEPTMKPK